MPVSHHHQVEARDDIDVLAVVTARRKEVGGQRRIGPPGEPPLIAVPLIDTVRSGRRVDPVGGNDLAPLPAAAAQVEKTKLGELAGRRVDAAEGDRVTSAIAPNAAAAGIKW